jgi:hypothetical protein
MANHRIVCVNMEEPHRHITRAGTGITADRHTRSWTIRELREALDEGDRFYVVSPHTGLEGYVHADTCDIDGCTIITIRSAVEVAGEENILRLPECG